MAVTFVGASNGSILVPTSAGFTAHAPAATAIDDLMLLLVNLGDGSTGGVIPPAGWAQFAGAFEPTSALAVYFKRADAGDAGGGATYHFAFAGGLDAPVWTNTVWRGAPDFTSAVHREDGGRTFNHTVPDVSLPSADTEDIVFATIEFVTGFAADPLAIAGFTQNVYVSPASNAVLAVFSKRAGSAGLQGTETITTTHNPRMAFIRLGLNPRVVPRGCYIAPFFVPLGNQPAPV